MSHEIFDGFSCGSEVVSRIEFGRFFDEDLPNGGGESESKVGIDVDFCDAEFAGLCEGFFGDAHGVGHGAAEFIDLFDKFLRNG